MPVISPQVSRVNPVGAHQLTHIAVLRKQRNRRDRLVRQHTIEVLSQCKAGPFDFGGCVLIAVFRLLKKALHSSFHRPQHQGRLCQAHHFQCANGLVQLLACDAKLPRIHRGQVSPARSFGIAHKTFERFGRSIQRFAQFIQHPGQRAQITNTCVKVGGC